MIPEKAAQTAITLAGQGVNVSEIARRTGHDRKTIRIYINGHRAPGQPRPHADSFAPFAAYVRQRAEDDPHLRAAGLHREITALGYAGSYSAFTRELRGHGINAGCGTCKPRQPLAPSPQHHPPQLPVRVAPLTGETISSCLSRLAAASHLPATIIAGCLPPWFAARAGACDDLTTASLLRPGDAGHLAALTGISETSLLHALPALTAAYGGRPAARAALACRRCAARHGQQDPVPVHLPAHQRACERHRTWLGRAIQIDVTAAPDIISAGRKAARLASQHGITAVMLAETTAPGSAPRRSPWPIPAWTPDTRTRPKQQPTPTRSRSPPRSSTTAAHYPAGRNNWQKPHTNRQRANFDDNQPPTFLPLNQSRAEQATMAGRFIWHRTYWERELGRSDFTFGQFGDNFTVDGLADEVVCVGDRYRIGQAL
ncbi:MAG: MOSC domain-containing protein, partial [Streptosporangiaceae bacterium]